VPKVFDVRLTVIGGIGFAVAIHAEDEAAHVDWRSRYDALRYEMIDTPADLLGRAVSCLRRFGLSYGAFDFSVDPDGRWWFLECNPSGQWGWLVEETGLPIAAAIADELVRAA